MTSGKPKIEWRRNGLQGSNAAGWQLRVNGQHVGTVYADGDWYTRYGIYERAGSQPLAAQALLRAAEVKP